jgi:hypothetical protein
VETLPTGRSGRRADGRGGDGRLPAVVDAELRGRRAAILAKVRGQVLDLDEPEARARWSEAIAGRVEPASRYDSIVCTGALMDRPDLWAAVRGLDRLLADDGDLWVVEPVNRPGGLGLLWSSLGAGLAPVVGRHVSRDVIRTLRAAGLTVADLDRFTVPTRAWPLRPFVQARVIRIERRRPSSSVDAVHAVVAVSTSDGPA